MVMPFVAMLRTANFGGNVKVCADECIGAKSSIKQAKNRGTGARIWISPIKFGAAPSSHAHDGTSVLKGAAFD
jgi:hypothetical protein